MTSPEGFVSRWARIKHEAASERGKAAEAKDIPLGSVSPSDPAYHSDGEAGDGVCDLSQLPPIESIMANTDIRVFLQTKVPAELTRAALRQAWASDPAIRDFVGIAENQWDFNDPNSIPGFGALHETDDVPALLQQALGRFEKLAETPSEARVVVENAQPAEISDATGSLDRPDVLGQSDEGGADETVTAADRVVEEISPLAEGRTHGGALPR
ncbi:DUF3306 domain-containing protein [Bradyrhizobium genosp. P]|uniref:DUF3306 domain-containing protein n=1 Tax=Bradyrhizobium genosp. P TaxID=83641 RepID=UPI003CF78E15